MRNGNARVSEFSGEGEHPEYLRFEANVLAVNTESGGQENPAIYADSQKQVSLLGLNVVIIGELIAITVLSCNIRKFFGY